MKKPAKPANKMPPEFMVQIRRIYSEAILGHDPPDKSQPQRRILSPVTDNQG